MALCNPASFFAILFFGSRFTVVKVAPGSYKIPVNWEPLLKKSDSRFTTCYFFPCMIQNQLTAIRALISVTVSMAYGRKEGENQINW